MVHSMTAFSRQQLEREWGSLTWEIRSVNHRYLEPSVRLPENFRNLENPIRKQLRDKLYRGKIECQLRIRTVEANQIDWHLNLDLISQLTKANSEINNNIGGDYKLSSLDILKWPGVISDQSIDEEIFNKEAMGLFEKALEDLMVVREREGASLRDAILKRIASIQSIIDSIQANMPSIIQKQKENLLNKLEEIKAEFEPIRLEQEITLLAQKADVDEELDRLNSHLQEAKRVLDSSGQIGRRLDFLMQELNREANTLSSKSIVVETTQSAVELKVLIEQMREQIQNIE
ncbi:MAG: YicC/YloC family endoribonuclease [Pseudohongiellaceae bacterium]